MRLTEAHAASGPEIDKPDGAGVVLTRVLRENSTSSKSAADARQARKSTAPVGLPPRRPRARLPTAPRGTAPPRDCLGPPAPTRRTRQRAGPDALGGGAQRELAAPVPPPERTLGALGRHSRSGHLAGLHPQHLRLRRPLAVTHSAWSAKAGRPSFGSPSSNPQPGGRSKSPGANPMCSPAIGGSRRPWERG